MKKVKPILIILTTLIVTIVIPLAINESYKHGVVYVTKWDAADVLSYYGTILASAGAIIGVYISIMAAHKNYQEDVRNRVLPFIAVTPLEHKTNIDIFAEPTDEKGSSNEAQSDYMEYKLNQYFFVIFPEKIVIQEELNAQQKELLFSGGKKWVSFGKGKILQNFSYISLPLEIENVGNGTAVNLRIGFNRNMVVPHRFIYPRMLKLNETLYIHIFSMEPLEHIEDEYVLKFYYEDIYGNKYVQKFPVTIEKENGRLGIELIGKQTICAGDDPYAHT